MWLWRQQLTEAGLVEELFAQFESYLASHSYQAKGGQILDATIVAVPKQHISKTDKEQLEQGEIPPRLAAASPSPLSTRHRCEVDEEEPCQSLWVQKPH